MKKIGKAQAAVWVLSLLPVVLTAVVYTRLPAEIPMHWDLNGQVGYAAKWQLWVVSGMTLMLEAVFYFLPRFDPKRRNYDKFSGSYIGFQMVMVLFMLAMTGICVVEALRPGTVDVVMVTCLLVGLLLVYLGNVMPKFRMNWFCGIKTPWTLSSEAVWTRTHRVAGRMFFAAGLLGMFGAFLPNDAARFAFLFAPVMVAAIVPTVLSFLWYRAEQQR